MKAQRKALKQDKKDPLTCRAVVSVALSRNAVAQARSIARSLVRARKNEPMGYFLVGMCLDRDGKYDDAIVAYEKALGKLGASGPAASAEIARRLVAVANDARNRGEGSLEEHAIVALGLLGRREAPVIDMLLGRLTDRENPAPRTRGLAAIALGFLGLRPGDTEGDQVRTAYRKTFLTADDDDLRIAVLVGMGLSGDKSYVPELLAMVAPGRAYRTQKIDDLVRTLESLTGRAPAQARGFALIALGKIGAATDDDDLRTRILDVLLTEMREDTFRMPPRFLPRPEVAGLSCVGSATGAPGPDVVASRRPLNTVVEQRAATVADEGVFSFSG